MIIQKSLYVICLFCFFISVGLANSNTIADGLVTAEGASSIPELIFSDNFESPVSPVSIISFTATPETIVEGETTTLSWDVANAESCIAKGGTADWMTTNITLPSGSANIAIGTAGPYTFELECQGVDNSQQTLSVIVTVNEEPQACDSVTLSGRFVVWDSYWSASFPGPVYENVTNWIVGREGYLALEFNTANFADDGKITALENASTPGLRTGAISECAGDFNVPAECKKTWGLGGGMTWATNGKAGACQLKPNTTYYFNITFTDGVDPNSSTCNNAPCRFNLQHVNF